MSDRDRTPAAAGAWGDAAQRGLDLLSQVRDTASEALRTRRDPTVVARRRAVAARRRLAWWSLLGVVLVAVVAAMVAQIVTGRSAPMLIGGTVLLSGLAVYAGVGAVRAGVDLRVRNRIVRRLPPAQPNRQPVARIIRPVIAQLDGYSDALRQAIGTVGVDGSQGEDRAMRSVRDDTLVAADAAEIRLRSQAAELTAILRAGAPEPGGRVAHACERLQHEIGTGVDEYGRLVLAAVEAAAASRELARTSVAGSDVARAIERLSALASGMREVSRSGIELE